VDWLRRSAPPQTAEGAAPTEARPGAAETAAPGVAALLEGVGEDRRHAVLDVGTATDPNLRAYTRFARRIRFADVLGEAVKARAYGPAPGLLRTELPPDRLYDLVFGWDVLDRLLPEERPRLLKWLADITLPSARLHFVVRAEHALDVPLRFTLVEMGRIRFEPADTAQPIGPRLLPADVMKLLPPFRIAKSFTLRSGFREYVVVPPAPEE
jgi:hypothetical protein